MDLTPKHIKQLVALGFDMKGNYGRKNLPGSSDVTEYWTVSKYCNSERYYADYTYIYDKNDWVTEHKSTEYGFNTPDELIKAMSGKVDIEKYRVQPLRSNHPYR